MSTPLIWLPLIICVRSLLSVGPENSEMIICPSFWSRLIFCTSAWAISLSVFKGRGVDVAVGVGVARMIGGFWPVAPSTPESRDTQPLSSRSKQQESRAQTRRWGCRQWARPGQDVRRVGQRKCFMPEISPHSLFYEQHGSVLFRIL